MFTHKNWREKKKVFLFAKFKSWLGSGKGIDIQISKSIHIFELKSLKFYVLKTFPRKNIAQLMILLEKKKIISYPVLYWIGFNKDSFNLGGN